MFKLLVLRDVCQGHPSTFKTKENMLTKISFVELGISYEMWEEILLGNKTFLPIVKQARFVVFQFHWSVFCWKIKVTFVHLLTFKSFFYLFEEVLEKKVETSAENQKKLVDQDSGLSSCKPRVTFRSPSIVSWSH